MGPDGWRILLVDAQGALKILASGLAPSNGLWNITVKRRSNGSAALVLEGREVWKGTSRADSGAMGLWVDSHSHLAAERFAITGDVQPGTLSFLYTEGLLGAGEDPKHWLERKDAAFRFGIGAVGPEGGGRVKWNFVGSGFTLWNPRGPEYGTAEIALDGATIATIELHAPQAQTAQPVFRKTGLIDGFHAVTLQSTNGRLVVDSLDVTSA